MSEKHCGIIMPLSSIAECTASHWQDVRLILEDSIASAGYVPRVVSFGKEVSIIHERIVKNLYSDEIVVCDVSCKNPNVMFELGLRLAFDKPVIVVKDDLTDYSFDTSPIEHISYPRSLRFAQINQFKDELKSKIEHTVKAKQENPDFSPFLSAFGPLKSAKMDTQEVPSQELILDYLSKISNRIDNIESSRQYDRLLPLGHPQAKGPIARFTISAKSVLNSQKQVEILNVLSNMSGVLDVEFKDFANNTEILVSVGSINNNERRQIAKVVLDIANGSNVFE